LVEKLPLAGMRVPSAAQAARTIADLRDGRPFLLRVWTTRMAGDGAERLIAGSQALTTAPVRVVMLCVDQGPNLAKARKLLAHGPLEADSGYVDGSALECLEITMIEVFHRADRAPLPLDLLLDSEGQLVALYLAPVGPAELAADLAALKKLDPKSVATPRFLGGRWLQRPHRDYAELARIYDGMGNKAQAELYERLAEQRGSGEGAGR
jgi:hypothetical protein